MRQIFAPILLLVLLFPALAFGETVKFEDLVERERLLYKKFSDVPFTGEVTGRYQGTFKDGKRDGPWVSYHDNGQLHWKGTYKDGEWDGPWVNYWDNGQLQSKKIYKNGKLDGPSVWYYDNGQLIYKGTYKNWKREGPWVEYNIDGTLNEERSGTFKDGVKVK